MPQRTPTFYIPAQPFTLLPEADSATKDLAIQLQQRFLQLNRQMQNIADGLYGKGATDAAIARLGRAVRFKFTNSNQPAQPNLSDLTTGWSNAYTAMNSDPRDGDFLYTLMPLSSPDMLSFRVASFANTHYESITGYVPGYSETYAYKEMDFTYNSTLYKVFQVNGPDPITSGGD